MQKRNYVTSDGEKSAEKRQARRTYLVFQLEIKNQALELLQKHIRDINSELNTLQPLISTDQENEILEELEMNYELETEAEVEKMLELRNINLAETKKKRRLEIRKDRLTMKKNAPKNSENNSQSTLSSTKISSFSSTSSFINSITSTSRS